MSNPLNIEIIESRTAGSNEPFEYSVLASDNDGSCFDKGFGSLAELMAKYPTRMSLLEWICGRNEFCGAISYCSGTEVILDTTSSVNFYGYPEDNSITEIKKFTHKNAV
jgi:hypothetical protein